MGKILFAIGLFGAVFTVLYDKIVGKGEIIFGPKSYTALVVCAIMVILGLVFWKQKGVEAITENIEKKPEHTE